MDTISEIDITKHPKAKYLALADAIVTAITNGTLAPGDQLPTVREFAHKVGVTPGTVARAYRRLTESGRLEARVGSGTFVSTTTNDKPLAGMPAVVIPRDPEVLDLRSPTLPDVGQPALIKKAMLAAADDAGDSLFNYPNRTSDEAARIAVANMLNAFPVGTVDPHHVVLTYGGQHAIGLILQTVLVGQRPVIMTEDLSYSGLRHAARLQRAEVLSIELDAEGPIPASIDALCRRHPVQILATTAEAHNPTTIRTSPERRAQIVELARRYDFQIIEDECYALLPGDDASYRALAPERTWYVSSISKSFCPSLRFGYFIAPEANADFAIITARHNIFGVSQMILDVAARVLQSSENLTIRKSVFDLVTKRTQILADALAGQDLHWRPGLPFTFLQLPAGWRASGFVRAAEDVGILVRPADEYVLLGGRAPNAVRIAINAKVSQEMFEGACHKLAKMLREPPHSFDV